ncbi:MAG: hypothetical protein PHE50_00035 [Dehalococcoidales bacterium]|nr:hypothetical protein [Dehalococcoidales bacterium]
MHKDSRELLGKLTAKVQHFALAPGGKPKYTAQDIAHILGIIKNEAVVLYARVKYCEQHEFSEDLTYLMRRKVFLDLPAIAKKKIPRPDWILNLCQMALIEATHNDVCTVCWGVGEILPDNAPRIVCGACDGYGDKKWRDNDRARLLEISKQSYSLSWAKLYREITQITISLYEDLLAGALKKRMS